jgi:hypothetical protein
MAQVQPQMAAVDKTRGLGLSGRRFIRSYNQRAADGNAGHQKYTKIHFDQSLDKKTGTRC